MIHLAFEGGLGNQLFQYAFGKYCEKFFHEKVCYDISKYKFEACEIRDFELYSFDISKDWKVEPLYKNRFRRFGIGYFWYLLITKPYIEINSRRYKKCKPSIGDALYQSIINKLGFYRIHYGGFLTPKSSLFKDKYIRGQWIFPEMVKAVDAEVRRDLQVVTPISEANAAMLDRIVKANSVGVHIRRGDFVSLGLIVCSIQYYEYCINEMKKRTESPTFFIFSDDIPWVKENLKVDANLVFVDNNNSSPEDFRLLSSCNHFIMSNSTFSWWAAYLGKAEDKIVITPKYWNVDDMTKVSRLVMQEWIAIDNRKFLDKK